MQERKWPVCNMTYMCILVPIKQSCTQGAKKTGTFVTDPKMLTLACPVL